MTTTPAPVRRAPVGRFRRLLACIGRAVRAAHTSSVPF
jgi:hypothetical protein